MDPTQQHIIPPPAAASDAVAKLDPAAATFIPPTQATNPLLNMGAATINPSAMPAPGVVLPPPGAASAFPPAAMNQLNPMMQFPVINDPVILGQLTGFPGELLANSPSMMAGAQQFLAQRLMQQQHNIMLSQAGITPVQALITPQQMQLMQQQRLQAQLAKVPKLTKAKGKPKSTTKKTDASHTAGDGTSPDVDFSNNNNTNTLPVVPLVKEDPGGTVLWAKVASSPWWPAKTMDRLKDRSYPPDADPPRPTAIPIRLFGSHEFAWVGSKRALVDWEKGYAQYSKRSDIETFALAVKEAETYLKEKTLPDVFYTIPHVKQSTGSGRKGGASGGKGRGKRGAGSGAGGGGAQILKKYASTAVIEQDGREYPIAAYEEQSGTLVAPNLASGLAALGPVIPSTHGAAAATATTTTTTTTTTKSRISRHGPEASVEERAALVFSRKKQRLYELGLLAPPDSPFVKGVVAENPALLGKLDEWEASASEVMRNARELVAKSENSKPPRAAVFRQPEAVPAAAELKQQQYQADPAATAAAIAAMQTQNAAYMMGIMNMPLTLASFV